MDSNDITLAGTLQIMGRIKLLLAGGSRDLPGQQQHDADRP